MVAAEQRRKKEEEAKRIRLQKLEGDHHNIKFTYNITSSVNGKCQTFMRSKYCEACSSSFWGFVLSYYFVFDVNGVFSSGRVE